MPSVKIPRKSTATDMTPFVDVAFLILAFFMLATKFKPPSPIQVTTPRSVSSDKLKQQDAVVIEFDSSGRVFFTLQTEKLQPDDLDRKRQVISGVNKDRNLGLTGAQIDEFAKLPVTIGSPANEVKGFFDVPIDRRGTYPLKGIPVDSTDNQLISWITNAKIAFAGRKLNYMIKGDNNAKYPSFKGVIEAMRKSDEYKYQLITDPEGVPVGTAEYARRQIEKD